MRLPQTFASWGVTIPGTGDPAHLAENMAAADLRLSTEDMTTLDALHRNLDA